ncbi:helix-turn-helix domain-containing protein [Paucibacter sp. PLA-PC-4]|uniref:GlxA family transcriptional regulator n=1 Tax=Paucibacter sp. PLA-PC-4 TaxID=2993655 RepID=UPI0022493AEB|nr:helix-turn-helix domain-containing protein [Paucibacter sp. PLA-PC-4]MCX2863067.1 helix-turn-helix domain-containing protein [Paucibacter sp. PLA-PC-4]
MSAIDVLMLVQPRALLLDLAGPAEALRLANQALAGRGRPPAFRLRFIAAQPQCVSSVGLALAGLEPLPAALASGSWLVLVGCRNELPGEPPPDIAELAAELAGLRWLAKQGQLLLGGGGRLLTVCSGALLAAQAGLLAGRRCTTHHELLDALRRAEPRAQVVDNRVFVLDGPLASSAGITAGIDLALHLIAQHCGAAMAATVAQTMVVYLRRSPADPELSPMLAHRHHLHPALHRVQDAICTDPTEDWTLTRMAEAAHVTPRHLSRLFAAHAGITPMRYLQAIRLERARQAQASGLAASQAALQAGFSSDQQLRRARRTAARC